MTLQKTIKREISLTGVGMHSGKSARLTLKPALPNRGITFVRTDLDSSSSSLVPIPAHFRQVVCTKMATTLGQGTYTISTVEHILAALQCLGIDNAVIEVDGPEVPIMDGSAGPFLDAILAVGMESQLQFRPFLALRKRIELKLGEKWVVAEPASRLEIHASIEWDHPSIGYQEFFYQEGSTSYEELLRSRTFGFLWEVESLKKMGLARGGSLNNAIVLDHALVLNPDGLRYPDELVKHKVLDALGDLKLAGIAIHAYLRLHRAGHDLHSHLLKEIFSNPDNYEIVDGASSEKKEHYPLRAPALATGLATG